MPGRLLTRSALVGGAAVAALLSFAGPALTGSAGAQMVVQALPDDPDQAANVLLSHALDLIDHAAADDDPVAARDHLLQADAALDRIVSEIPAADLAIQLRTGQPIGTFSAAVLEELIADAENAIVQAEEEVVQAALLAEDEAWCAEHTDVCRLFDDARRLADAIDEDTWAHERALNAIVRGQVAAGLFAQARETAAVMPTLIERISMLGRIADSEADAGFSARAARAFASAVSLTHSIDDIGDRAESLSEIALHQAFAGFEADAQQNFAQARRLAGSLQDQSDRDSILIQIEGNEAWARWDPGNLETSAPLCSALHNAAPETGLAEWIVEENADGEDFTALLDAANALTNATSRDAALRQLADSQSAIGMFAEACTAAEDISSERDRGRAIRSIIDAQIQAAVAALDQ